jgi:eukaryotic-like serine/threonine-protein kinase
MTVIATSSAPEDDFERRASYRMCVSKAYTDAGGLGISRGEFARLLAYPAPVEGADGPHQLSEGTMLDDKYRIERLLATGGMGAVYIGTHTRLRKRVAIKVLSAQHASAPGIERFRREAITASQIGHEGIAQVTDLGMSRDGEPFLVMEYLEGESLASRLRARGALQVDEACEISCAILSPLGAAHGAGIVHRDLKPDNVFLVRQSRGEMVKLLDFGISRVAGVQPEFRLTMTGLVLGTPLYMSPEQARGESHITTAADIYAFGVILYEMLIGDVPIRADNYNQLMYRVTMSDFRPPRQLRPTMPPELERVILHAMAQTPADRPSSTAVLEQALLPFCRPVFRERASARLSTPVLSLSPAVWRTPRPDADRALYEGETLRDAPLVHPPDEPVEDVDDIADQLAESSSVRARRVGSLDGSVAAADDAAPTTAAARRPGRRLASGIAVAVVAVVAIGALMIVRAGDGEPTAARPEPPPPSAAPAEAPAPPPPTPGSRDPGEASAPIAVVDPTSPAGSGGPTGQIAAVGEQVAPETITLRLAVDPPGAAVTLDGGQVRGTELAVVRDGARHHLRITAAGYVDYDEVLRFDESQRIVVQLKRVSSPVRGRERRRDRVRTEPERPERLERIESRSPYE